MVKLTPEYLYYENFDTRSLGVDVEGNDVSLLLRKDDSNVVLLKVLSDGNESFTKSGKWWMKQLTKEEMERVTTANAKKMIENSEEYYIGGSFYGRVTLVKDSTRKNSYNGDAPNIIFP